MTRWMVGSSLKFKVLVLAVAVALMALGIYQLRSMPVETFPEFMPTRVEVQTEALGLSAEEVEQLLTNPLEQEFFNGVPWLAGLRSSSLPGLSSIEMIFEPGTDLIKARQVVQERLTMVPALPAAASKPPFVVQPVASTNRLMMIGPLRLGDVAQVVEDHQLLIGDAVVNDAPSLMLVVERFPEANVRDVSGEVEDALRAMQPGLAGIQIDTTVFRPASFIDKLIDNLTTALLIGLPERRGDHHAFTLHRSPSPTLAPDNCDDQFGLRRSGAAYAATDRYDHSCWDQRPGDRGAVDCHASSSWSALDGANVTQDLKRIQSLI